VRITRQQNFIVANVPDERVDEVVDVLAAIGLALDANHLRGRAVGCTGEPHCNFSVTETKQRLGRLIEHLEARFGDAISSLGLQLDGCPHACAQHWIADLGFQGTTARDADGKRVQAYDIFVRGGLGPDAQIGKALFGAFRARSSTRPWQDSSRAGSTAAAARTNRSPSSRAGRATRSSASRPGSSRSRDAYARRRNEHGAVR